MKAPNRPRFLPLPGWREPEEILPLFAGDPMPALLRSGRAERAPEEIGRWSFLCADPFETVAWREGDGGDPFDRVTSAVARHPCLPVGEFPFAGGAIGYFAYEAGRLLERIGRVERGRGPAPLAGMPLALFGLYGWGVVWDHAARRWGVVATGLPGTGSAAEARAEAQAVEVAARIARAGDPLPGRAAPAAEGREGLQIGSSLGRAEYVERVLAIKRLIAAGDLYQVNLAQQLELEAAASPPALFAALARHSPAPFSSYLAAGPVTLLSASPERFVRLSGREAQSRPIKGTRPRGASPGQDRALAAALAASEKDRAENVMIVDLVRNDLGRVCEPGSVQVDPLCELESYASVHHLVSTVRGRLREGAGAAELLKALFPPGSMTGAPKVRAMQAIEALEPVPRGPYAGALGFLSFSGDLDLSVVIRTLMVAGTRAWLHVGGGVVADSDPEAEYQESLDKAASVRRAIVR